MTQWIPHERDTWPYHYGVLKEDVQGSLYRGYWENGEPVMEVHHIPKGTTVRIVMVSRFGDVGITDKLDDAVGYRARVTLDILDLREAP